MGLYFDAPEAPDPKETASAQMGQNVNTAIANSYLQNVNQNTPYGSMNWSVSDTYKMTDPNSGEVYDVPRWSVNQTLSPTQQQLFDTEQTVKQNLANLGASQSARLNDVLSQPFDLSSLPARNNYNALPTYTNQAPVFGSGPQLQMGQNLNTGAASGGNILSSFGQTKSQIPTELPNAPSLMGLGDVQKKIEGVGKINTTFSGGGGLQRNIEDPGAITKSYNTDFSDDRRRVEDAIYSRLDPQLDRGRESLRTQLVNQGIGEGSEAFDRAMSRFGQQENDARMQTILAGGQEQSRMVGLEADRAAFENAAQNLNYTQLMGQADLNNNASMMDFQQAAARAAYELGAQGQGYDQLMGQAMLNNSGIAQDWGQRLAQAQFGQTNFGLGLAAQGQEYGQLYDRARFSNDAQAQRYGQSRQNIDSYNAAQQQMNQNYNSAAQTMYGNYMTSGQANFDNANSAFGQNFNAEMARANAENSNRSAALQEAYAARNQPINEIAALMSGAQLTQPNFQQTNIGGIPTVDEAGIINDTYKLQLQAAQAEADSFGNIFGGVADVFGSFLGGPFIGKSDIRAKTDIAHVGSMGGHNIYRFRYKDGGGFVLGVMAQEVEKTRPDAVSTGPDGLLRVDYGALFPAGA